MFAILIFFIIFIFFCAAFYFSQGTFPEPFRKTAIFKNPKTGQYEEKNIDEKGNIIPEKKELQQEKNNQVPVDNPKKDLIIAKIIKKEIDGQKYNELIWLRAFKKAKGNKEQAQALYAEYRAEQLEEEFYNQEKQIGKSIIKNKDIRKVSSNNDNSFFENSNFLSGREKLTTAFWLYVFVGNFVFGFIVGLLSVAVGSWILIFLIGYLIFSTIGLWKCADSYTSDKQSKRQSYGWAIGAKLYVVINLIYLPFQIIQFIGR